MDENLKNIEYIPVEDILPNRFQPRLAFDEKELNKLAGSITKYGIIQPIVLRAIGDKYEIIAGERRYKASVLAGLKKVPAIVKNTDDNTSAEIALLENLQRRNLTPIEEAQSFKKLMDRGFTQEEIAKKMGISQSTIANKLRLLGLPKKVQDALLYGRISERHARSLLSLDDKETQLDILDRIINEKLTVKQTEDEISNILNSKNNINLEEEIHEVFESKPLETNSEIINRKFPSIFDENDEMYGYIPKKLSNSNVVKINDISNEVKEKTDEYLDINPFQNNKKEDFIDINDIKKRKEVIISDKIRECVNSFSNVDPSIRFNIIDEDKIYKIVIEIDKDTK